jgi:hypothetical protein
MGFTGVPALAGPRDPSPSAPTAPKRKLAERSLDATGESLAHARNLYARVLDGPTNPAA